MEDRYQHIRSATGKLYYAGEVFLIDPLLAKKGVYPGFPMTKRSELFNPLTELPMPIEEILKDVTCVMVTHTHSDHWDLYAEAYIKKDLPIYVQHAADANFIRVKGFKNVKVLGRGMMQGKVKLTRTACQHASDSMLTNPETAKDSVNQWDLSSKLKDIKKFMLLGILYGMIMSKLKLKCISLIIVY